MIGIKPKLAALPDIAADVLEGLLQRPRRLPPKLFYDARGSALFERITRLPEYYLTRTEQAILRRRAREIVAAAGQNLTLVELGAGSARKTGLLISALLRRQLRVLYVPIDVSPSALDAASLHLRSRFPALQVRPHIADFTNGFGGLAQLPGRKLAMFIGSSIGNFEPQEAIALLTRLRRRLTSGDVFLLGTDLVKDASLLVPAYDDTRGVTAEFNKNVLARINRELGGGFDLSAFRHVAQWNPRASRMEMYLESTCPQRVPIAALGLELPFAAGERIHTENSYKYRVDGVHAMLRAAGFEPQRTWTDDRNWFSVHLARVE